MSFGNFRRTCSACGAPIVWLTLDEARQDAKLAQDLAEAASWLGGPVDSVWRCTRSSCDEAGFFGAPQFG